MTGQTSFIEGAGAGSDGGKPAMARPAGLLMPAEVAKELGLSDQTIYNWIGRQDRPLPVESTTVGSNGRPTRWLRLADVIAWMRANPGSGRSGGQGGKRRRAGRKAGGGGSRESGIGNRVKGKDELPLVEAAMASAFSSSPDSRLPTPDSRPSDDSSALTNPLDVVNLEKQRLQNDLLRIKLDEQRGLTVSRAEVTEAILRGGRQVRMLLEAFTAKLVPDALSAMGAPVSDRPRLEAVVAERVEEILAELARIEISGGEGENAEAA